MSLETLPFLTIPAPWELRWNLGIIEHKYLSYHMEFVRGFIAKMNVRTVRQSLGKS